MLTAIKSFFDQYLVSPEENETDIETRLRVATVALLLETARADFNVQDQELQIIAEHARHFFQLDHNETGQLIELAQQEALNATSYYGFTSLINQQYSPQEKIHIIELMWRVAYADSELEKYEEALVRKIAELLYVPHGAFIAAKLRVRVSMGLD